MRNVIFFLYRLLQVLASPFIVLYFVARIVRDRRYAAHFGERLGFLPHTLRPTAPGAVWLHAVSVGEVVSALPLVEQLRLDLRGVPLYVSVTTVAGREIAEQKLRHLVDGLFYAPIDFQFAVRRVLRWMRPALVIVMETEIWPNLYRDTKRFGASLMIVNGRISDRAFPRYRAFRWFFTAVLAQADCVLAQSETDRERYLATGAPAGIVRVNGNLKYDFDASKVVIPRPVCDLIDASEPGRLWIAASTMPPREAGDVDEDDIVIAEFHKLAARYPSMMLLLVPRRPERFEPAAEKLTRAGVRFLRRSQLAPGAALELPGVLLVDTMGELTGLFPLADAVFMGGTLARRGGHNILEPAFFARAVICGPHMENFTAIAEEFTREGGIERIAAGAELADGVARLFDDEPRRERIGNRAFELAQARRGAAARAVEEARRLIDEAVPLRPQSFGEMVVFGPLALLWNWGGTLKRRRAETRRGALSVPVISVGNLTMGGAGKTPFVLWLSERLRKRGVKPAILTRGYGRRHPQKQVLLNAGEAATTGLTGDEAQLFVRAGIAPVGIGADRLVTGRALVEKTQPDIVLLDDGFQHWPLQRDLDIVLVDALNPLGGGHVFPLGRLREPLKGLERAGAIVLTRTSPGRNYRGLVRRLRALNAGAPIFQSRVKPVGWMDGDRQVPLDSAAVAAFCGLGNAASFWKTLGDLGLKPACRFRFGDHHRYNPKELLRLRASAMDAGAQVLVTTEKDFMNLPPDTRELVAPLRLCWLKIDLEIDGEEPLLDLTRLQVEK